MIHEKLLCQFIYKIDGQSKGKLTYRYISVNKIDAYSTQVKPEFRGKGIAEGLYNALIDFAKQQQLKIKPSCSYIEKRMERNNQDLIA
ncbi:GNAT family N-acetyltransferase [Ursidibacter arcticus]